MNQRRTALRVVGAMVLLYILYIAVIFGSQQKVIYPGAGYAFEPPPTPAGVVRWTAPIEGGEVHAFFAPAAKPDAPGVVLLHGNMACAEHTFGAMAFYRKLGFSVLMPEYRGFAGAAGEPTEEGIAADLANFTQRFADDPAVDASHLLYHGTSLGGATAAALAKRRPPRALILQSTFTSIASMAHEKFAPGFLAHDSYDTEALLAETDVPVLLMHGTEDTVIPVEHAKENAAVARNAKLLLLPGGHGIPIDAASAKEYNHTILGFLGANGFPSVLPD